MNKDGISKSNEQSKSEAPSDDLEFKPVGYYDVPIGGQVHQIVDVIDALKLNFRLGNVMKYVARAGRKPGAKRSDDLKKALDYLAGEYFLAAQEDEQLDAAAAIILPGGV